MATLDNSRIKSIESIKKISDYEDLNIYSMDVYYDYDLANLTPDKLSSSQDVMDMTIKEVLPGLDVSIKAPDFGCSSFSLKNEKGEYQFGRNYDFKFDTSAMIVRTHPKDGYASVAISALNNLGADDALASDITKGACLATPFACLDGINEKGVGISVLTLDSAPVNQDTGKPKLATGILIRMVLDRAASTADAVEMLSKYDMYATNGRDYHFFITDKTGDSRIIEFDPESETRDLVATPTKVTTNFFVMYKDLVKPHQNNGIYGHGRERYDAIEGVMNSHNNVGGLDVAWEAIKSAAQLPNPASITSNTQWSAIYNLSTLEFEFVLHRKWEDVYKFKMRDGGAL